MTALFSRKEFCLKKSSGGEKESESELTSFFTRIRLAPKAREGGFNLTGKGEKNTTSSLLWLKRLGHVIFGKRGPEKIGEMTRRRRKFETGRLDKGVGSTASPKEGRGKAGFPSEKEKRRKKERT